ncbi:MAG TPA: anhydro-N-acetylmuramic acid kinase [Polyangia bacterium]
MPEADALARLIALRALPERLVAGVSSGTSADGIDVALCRITGAGAGVRVVVAAFATVPFARPLARRIFALSGADASELCELDVLLGEAFGDAVLAVAAQAGLARGDLHLVGSHGQTVAHQPRSAGRHGATLQIGEAANIAERVGVPVICDFRVRDVAAGGEGAPLVPLVDSLLFRDPGRTRALQNIGGISNVTVVPRAGGDAFAFDNGPGNMTLDAVARTATGGAESYDRDGARAARGRVDDALLARLLRHPFLALPPPKSTGREAFGRTFVGPLLDRYRGHLDDLLATLTLYTARTIADSYAAFVTPRAPLDEVYVSGGGVHNHTLMAHLARLLAPVPVRSLADLGFDPDGKEAVAFAVLANETLFGHPGNVPAATGAAGPRVLGKIVLA